MAIKFDEDKQNRKVDDLRKQEEEELAQVLAEAKYNIPYINLLVTTIENEALRIIPEPEARAIEVAPFKVTGKNISVAVRAPSRPEVTLFKEELEKKGYKPTFYMVSLASLEKAWSRYAEISFAEKSKSGSLDISPSVLADLAQRIKTMGDVGRVAEEITKESKTHKATRMLEVILAGAISTGASDIHIEPEEHEVHVRFRLDGVLQNIMQLDFPTHKLLNSRIKLISGLKITSTTTAQDGRFGIFMNEVEISMRVSVIPGAYGESVVMRILDPKSIQHEIESMGMDHKLYSIVMDQIKKPNGLILITGPTGSGKTTTLYGFLRKIYSPELKIITIEDPIEYHLAGITQTQVEEEKGYTFLAGLRAALRQDPDVIMVGEIRDGETAKTAIESALTGHLVFSTLHTNDAAGVIPRLIDLGVNPKIMTSALRLSIAQRLVRKLCVECKKEKTPTELELKTIKNILQTIVDEKKDLASYNVKIDQEIKLWEAIGCEKCNGTGYKGRLGIFEAIESDAAIEALVPTNPSEREIKKAAIPQGILTMREDGIIKILNGVTSYDEVGSVVDLNEA